MGPGTLTTPSSSQPPSARPPGPEAKDARFDKLLLVTSATLVVTGALLVVTKKLLELSLK